MGLLLSKIIEFMDLSNKAKKRPSSSTKYTQHYTNSGLQFIDEYISLSVNPNLSNTMPNRSGKASEVAISKHRPLVVLIAWMTARERHMQKFRAFYGQRGFDVLTVRAKMFQVFTPETGTQVVAKNVLKYLLNHSEYKDIIIHAFSIGGYLFGECLVEMKSNLDKYGSVIDRIRGLIFDSVVDYDQAPIAVSKSLTTNYVLQKILQHLMNFILWISYSKVTRHYIRSSDHFHEIFLSVPILVLVSLNDELGNFESNANVAKHWKSLGKDVQFKCWESSGHVQHFVRYPEEYASEVDKLLAKSGVQYTPVCGSDNNRNR